MLTKILTSQGFPVTKGPAVPVDPADGLGVVTGVPAGVEDDDSVGPHQVDPQAAGSGGHQEQLHLGGGGRGWEVGVEGVVPVGGRGWEEGLEGVVPAITNQCSLHPLKKSLIGHPQLYNAKFSSW